MARRRRRRRGLPLLLLASAVCGYEHEVGPKSDLEELYLETLVGLLTGESLGTESWDVQASRPMAFEPTERSQGRVFCKHCLTMLGSSRLRDLWQLLREVEAAGVRGDFVNAGVWRGGVAIFAKAFFRTHSPERSVFACDSFEGFPGRGLGYGGKEYFSVGVEAVRDSFKHLGLLDDKVNFVKGFFNVTLPDLRETLIQEGRSISVLHLDSDQYPSYMDSLFHLYELISPGGVIVCDDCGFVEEADRAVADFRIIHRVPEPLEVARGSGLTRFWRKAGQVQLRPEAYECFRSHGRLRWGVRSLCSSATFGNLLAGLRGFLDFLPAEIATTASQLLGLESLEGELAGRDLSALDLEETYRALGYNLLYLLEEHGRDLNEVVFVMAFDFIQVFLERSLYLLSLKFTGEAEDPEWDPSAMRLLKLSFERRIRLQLFRPELRLL